MGAFDKGGVVGIAPGIGVEMEAEHEIGLEGIVDEFGAGADLGGAVEQALGEFLQRGGGIGGFAANPWRG